MGLSTAYYLLSNPSLPSGSTVTLVERTGIAHGASGRAMGMIGREWQTRHTLPLSRLSWKCYEEMDEAFGHGQWEWMTKSTLGIEVEGGAALSRYRKLQKGAGKGKSTAFNGDTYTMDSGEAVGYV